VKDVCNNIMDKYDNVEKLNAFRWEGIKWVDDENSEKN